MRREPAQVRRVVAWDERLDPIEPVSIGMPSIATRLVRTSARVDRVHDVQAVRERVQPERIQCSSRVCDGSPGKSPVCPLRGPRSAMIRMSADEELVPRDARRAPRERAHLGLEPLPRDAAVRRRMNLLDRRAELTDVVSERSTGAEGRACADETIATMASGTRSRPGIRMALR